MLNKVLILHATAIMGGAEHSLLEFLHNLKEFPVEIHISLSSQAKKLLENKINVPVHFHNYELHYLEKHPKLKSQIQVFTSLITYNYRIFQLVEKEHIQTVYCNTFRTIPYCLATKLFSKTRVICHCRDPIPSKWIQYLIKLVGDKVIAVSIAIKNQISPNIHTEVIHNGVNVFSFSDTKPTKWLHKKLNLLPNVQLIGNIGQIVKWKNQTDYILVANELIKKNPNLDFLLIGGAVDNNYFHVLKQQINSLRLNPYFTLTGQVEDIKKYIGELDILVHTAINEPFGRVIIEAAATSKPVIAYSSGGVSEIIKQGETGFLVATGDIETMVKMTTKLLDNPGLRTKMGESARKHVTRHFNSGDYARKVYQILAHD